VTQVDKVSKMMQRLLWENSLRAVVEKVLITVPVLGWPVFKDVFLYLIDTYFVEKMFDELSRWGVFVSIDWKTEEQYQAYLSRAKDLVEQQTTPVWSEGDRKAFKDAARDLIRFHLAT
jgi:hypothetical protein